MSSITTEFRALFLGVALAGGLYFSANPPAFADADAGWKIASPPPT